MLLSYNRLLRLQQDGVIQNSTPELVNSSSIDITLGDIIRYESFKKHKTDLFGDEYISLKHRQPLPTETWNMALEGGYLLAPGEFILASTREIFNLPNTISAEYKCKSSMARVGLNHLNAGWCDAGWYGSVLTLELKNENQTTAIRLTPGDKIGQMVFFEHEAVPEQGSYATKGNYNNHDTVMGAVPETRFRGCC